MLLVCSTPMMSLMCPLPIMLWNSALAQFAGINDVQRAAQRFRVSSCAGPFGCSLLLLPTLNVFVSKHSNCIIRRLGLTCEITSQLGRNNIVYNSVFAKILMPIWLLPRICSSRLLCRPSKDALAPKTHAEKLLKSAGECPTSSADQCWEKHAWSG